MNKTTKDRGFTEAERKRQLQEIEAAERGLAHALENLRQHDPDAFAEEVTPADLYQLTLPFLEGVQALPEVKEMLEWGRLYPDESREGFPPWAHAYLLAAVRYYEAQMKERPQATIPYPVSSDFRLQLERYHMVSMVERCKLRGGETISGKNAHAVAAKLLFEADHPAGISKKGKPVSPGTVKNSCSMIKRLLDGKDVGGVRFSENPFVREVQRARVLLATTAMWRTPGSKKEPGLPIPSPVTVRRILQEL